MTSNHHDHAADAIEVTLKAMAHGGSALGRHADRTVFIPYTIPGERVRARITQDKGRIAFAEGLTLLDASADRVFPRCPHFGPGRCGVCHWQHIEYGAQLLLKQDVLADQLARVGGFDEATLEAAVRPVVASPQPWAYSHDLTFLVTETGELALPGAGESPPTVIELCYILHPELLALLDQLDLDVSGVKRLRVQRGSDGAQMVILSVDSEDDAPELESDLRGISVNLLLPEDEPVNLIGDLYSQLMLHGRALRVTAGGHYRPNLSQLEALTAAVAEAVTPGTGAAVLELYAGAGVLSALIAPRAARMTLVERYPPSVNDADHNLAAFTQLDLIEGAVEDVLPTLKPGFDVALLDPPAEGVSIPAMDALAALDIPRVVYVSSDPATLARDGKRLARHGYRLRSAQPFDLAPQTYQIDTVTVFSR